MKRKLISNTQFEDPRTFLEKVEQKMEGIPNHELFNGPNPEYQKLRECWCAAMFGIGYSRHKATCAVAVNMSKSRLDGDFRLRAEDRICWEFQIAESLPPERRRGAEYSDFSTGRIKSIPYEPERGRLEVRPG